MMHNIEQMNFHENPQFENSEDTLFDRAVEIFLEKRRSGQSHPNPTKIIEEILGHKPEINAVFFNLCSEIIIEGQKRWKSQFLPNRNETPDDYASRENKPKEEEQMLLNL